jgi:uncharacterized peroxidase-related enzyme
MKTIQVPNKEQVNNKAGVIFDKLEKGIGMVPNLYATIGYSSDILEGYLAYADVVGSTSFNKKEGEAIKLAVSEVNNCQYCKAAHTALAKMNGFSEAETIDIRTAQIKDKKLNTIIKTAQELAVKRGKISDETKDRFFALGYENKAFIDLIAIVNVASFTNFVHNATQVPVDFPAAPALLGKTA